jgi:hypothetical protein
VKNITRRTLLASSVVTFVPSALFSSLQLVASQDLPLGGQARSPWWEQDPLRILDYGGAFGQVASPSPAELAARKASLAYNSEHLHVMEMSGGLDDQGFFFSSKMAGRKNEDYLRRYLPEAKKRGLRVIVYFNVHWYKHSFGDKHRDWLQVREDGRPLTGVYETGTDFCVNGPWREWCFQILRDLCAYPIDGIFYDGPIFFPDTCYCRYCREKFRTLHGAELPSKKERKGKAFWELLEFQAGSLREYLRDSRKVIKSINPDVAFYMNGGVRGANWATGRLNRILVPEQDILGSEGGFLSGDLLHVPVWKPGVTARLLETQAPDKARVIFSAASHKPWTFSLLPEPELRLLYASSIANGASVWFGVTPSEFAQPEMKAVTEMNRFVAKNAGFYRQARSEASAALVWSDTTANFYAGADAQLIDIDRVPQRSEVGNLDGEFSGLAEALLRTQTPFDVIDDVTLEREELSRYAAIFLPNVACLSQLAARHLADYVRSGGNLFATFETSLFDETGMRRADFALAEVLGVSEARRIAGPHRWDFMKPRGASPLLEGLQREFVPSPVYHVVVKPRGGEALLHFTKPLAGRYDGIPEVSDDPALVVHRFGKGRAIYCSGDLGNAIHSFHLADFFRLIENVARGIAPSPVVIENAPRSMEVVLRSQEQGRRLLLHLINFTGEMTRPIRRVLPIENVRVTLRAKGELNTIRALMRPQTFTPRRIDPERVQFVVPRIEEYEVVVLEK